MLVSDKIIMRNDPIYLFQELTWKASLGVLSVAGNVCRVILSEKLDSVKVGLDSFFLCVRKAKRGLGV